MVHVQRGRLAPAAILAVLMALAVIVTLGILARPASAKSDYTTCASCHTSQKHTSNSTHKGLYDSSACATCHVNGFAAANKGVTPKACATCHKPVADVLAKTTHAANACGTTPGCHGYTSPTPSPSPSATVATTKMTLKAKPSSVKVRKSIKFYGVVKPLPTLAGAKIAFKVERKVGKKWVKMKTGSVKVSATNGAYKWTYKAKKKGAHRVKATIAKKANVYTGKKLVKAFKVK